MNTHPYCEVLVKGVSQPDPFKQQAQKVVKEINNVLGCGYETKINVEPISKMKGLYSLSIVAYADGEVLTVNKKGKKLYSLLRRAKKTVFKLAREARMKRVKNKRKNNFKLNFFSYEGAS